MFFSHSRTFVISGTFLRVLYNNIHHHHVAFARELEEKEKNTEQDQPAVRFIFHLVMEQSFHSRGNRTPESEKKQTSVYVIKRKLKKKLLVYVPGA